ncbi:MAG: protein translocase subunit SecF [Rickettsiales bacterium]|jgi:preprotein translocase SecF subunit|nr:protein translocase subunit SecF [Rickettsiales bacterium]
MFKLVNLIPIETHFKIMKHTRFFLAITAAMCIAACAIIFTKSFAYGIDFSGGVLVEAKTRGPADVEEMRKQLAELAPRIQALGNTGDLVSIYLAKGDKDEGLMLGELNQLKSILGDSVEYRNTQIVGPKVGADLIRDGIIAVILSILVISLYIGMRFELPFAVGSLLSIAHDVLLALALMSIMRIGFELTTLAALLTLAGYSINDTVVIYDRIRENLKKHRAMPIAEVIDMSINETFSRTVLTGLTTLLALVAIYMFGGEVLRGFSAIMIFGVIVGTWSSVFISTSTLLMFKKLKE